MTQINHEELIGQWHRDRNLIDGSTDKDQYMKLIQEAGELSDSLCKGKDIRDDIGDMMVVLINIMVRNNLTMKEVILAIAEKYKVKAENVPWPEVSLFAEHGDIVFNSEKLNNIIEYRCKNDFFKWLKKI